MTVDLAKKNDEEKTDERINEGRVPLFAFHKKRE